MSLKAVSTSSGGSSTPSQFFVTTMSTSNTGAQNATALTSDITNAAGALILVPSGNYILAAVSVSSANVNIWFMPGSQLRPDSSLFYSGTMVLTTGGTINLYNLTVNGLNNGCPIMWRSNTPNSFYAYNTTMLNVGSTAIGAPSSTGVYGFFIKGAVGTAIVDGWNGSNFNDSTSSGLTTSVVRHVLFYNCPSAFLNDGLFQPGTTATHQVDYVQTLDDLTPGTMLTTLYISDCYFFYNENIRRCLKRSTGNVYADNINIRMSATFTPVSGSTNVGIYNLNAVDASSSSAGTLHLTNSYVDATGFQTGVSNSIGANATVIVDNCDIIMGSLNVIRNNPDSGAPQNQPPISFLVTAGDTGSGIMNSRFYGGCNVASVNGTDNFIRNCTFDDPRAYIFDTGDTGASGLEIVNNTTITRTPGFLSENGFCARIQNVADVRLYMNTLKQEGNTTEATTFISVSSASATGYATLTTAPAGITPIDVGSSAIVATLSNNAFPASLSTKTVVFIINGQGSVPTTGAQNTSITVPYNGTITNWYISADQTGSCVIDVLHSGSSIVGGGNMPTLTSAISSNAAVSGWASPTLVSGEILTISLTSAASVTNITLVLQVSAT